MKMRFFSVTLSAVCSGALLAPALLAQNSIPLFGAVDTRPSQSNASYTTPVTFNTITVNLNCQSSSPVAVLSSTPSTSPLASTGYVLADNNITVSNSYSTNGVPVTNGPTEVCPTSAFPGPTGFPNCFNATGYQQPVGALLGQDPDTYVLPSIDGGNGQTVDQGGGVPPINISSQLIQGSQALTINLNDEGGYVASSSLYLNTNCTQGGSTGPALVNGNTIPPNPTPQQLTQTFSFDQSNNQVVGFVYDLSTSQTAGTLTIDPNGSTPQTADLPVNPATFQANFVPYTSFATSQCLIHTGELGGPLGQPATTPACKLFTLECIIGTGSSATGAQCPSSSSPNEVVQDIFDGPTITLKSITTPSGQTYNVGFGFLMASEGWGSEPGVPPGTWNWNGGTGGPCTFDPAANLNLPCPQNLLVSFTGPGGYTGSGLTTHPNSTFISVAGIPLISTQIRINNAKAATWVNTHTPTIGITAIPPNLQGTNVPGAAAFIPSPVQSVTYGVSPANAIPTPAQEPIPGDVTLWNTTCPIPTPGNPGPAVVPTFIPAVQTLPYLADGNYQIHYFAQDCAGTLEYQYQKVAGSWMTTFFTRPINVDTTPPVISGLTLSPGPYSAGTPASASYSCSDSLSGVATCGTTFTSSTGSPSTGTITVSINTASKGSFTFTVKATDIAGNVTTTSVPYTVGP